MTPLEQWLVGANKGLSPQSSEQVRKEIEQHCELANEAGDDAVAALGDPKKANREYRKVLITDYEERMAPAFTQPKPRSLPNMLLTAAVLAPVIWSHVKAKNQDSGSLAITIAIFSTLPLTWFFPQNTLERTRIFLYIHGVRNLVVVALAWWYQGWMSAITLGALCFVFDYLFAYQRLTIFRKIASGQTVNPLEGEPVLTHNEAIWLNTMRNWGSPVEYISITFLFVMMGAVTIWQPATFAPMTTWMVLDFIARRTLPIYTEERSRWFRLVKWTTAVVAGLIPVLYGALIPWAGGIFLLFFCAMWDLRSIPLRRKLPVEQWPKRLYW